MTIRVKNHAQVSEGIKLCAGRTGRLTAYYEWWII